MVTDDAAFPWKTRHDPLSGHPPFRGLWSGFCLRESGELKHLSGCIHCTSMEF